MSAAYCGDLDEPAWERAAELAQSLTPNEACQVAGHVEVVAFDERTEHAAGRFALRA